jgi:excisionase family DNA binding protein
MLGLSVTTVQQLVERGVLQAWKTQGGHRRIAMDSVRQLAEGHRGATLERTLQPGPARPAAVADGEEELHVLVAEDNPMQKALYQRHFASWQLPIRWTFQDNGYLVLLDLERTRYDVLLLDIMMPRIDGLEVIRAIRNDPALRSIDIAVVSGLEPAEVDRKGGLPPDVLHFTKPIVFDELRGYLRGCLARKQTALRLAI